MLSARKWPYLTFIVLVASVFAHAMSGVVLLDSLSRSGMVGLVLTLFLHPFVHHIDPWHLWSDLVLGFLVMVVLVESWVALNWKYRYKMYLLAYVSSLIAYLLTWQWVGFTHNMIIGLSGMVCAGFVVLLPYYWVIRKSLRFERRDIFALIGLGYLLSFLVSSIVYAFTEYAFTHAQDLGAADSAIYHFLAFVCGFCLSWLLLRDRKVRSTLLQTRSRPSHTSNCTSHSD